MVQVIDGVGFFENFLHIAFEHLSKVGGLLGRNIFVRQPYDVVYEHHNLLVVSLIFVLPKLHLLFFFKISDQIVFIVVQIVYFDNLFRKSEIYSSFLRRRVLFYEIRQNLLLQHFIDATHLIWTQVVDFDHCQNVD